MLLCCIKKSLYYMLESHLLEQLFVFLRLEFDKIGVAPLAEVLKALVAAILEEINAVKVAVGRVVFEYCRNPQRTCGSVIQLLIQKVALVQAEFFGL